jgi:Flp pilus assembly CpaF family ATPase
MSDDWTPAPRSGGSAPAGWGFPDADGDGLGALFPSGPAAAAAGPAWSVPTTDDQPGYASTGLDAPDSSGDGLAGLDLFGADAQPAAAEPSAVPAWGDTGLAGLDLFATSSTPPAAEPAPSVTEPVTAAPDGDGLAGLNLFGTDPAAEPAGDGLAGLNLFGTDDVVPAAEAPAGRPAVAEPVPAVTAEPEPAAEPAPAGDPWANIPLPAPKPAVADETPALGAEAAAPAAETPEPAAVPAPAPMSLADITAPVAVPAVTPEPAKPAGGRIAASRHLIEEATVFGAVGDAVAAETARVSQMLVATPDHIWQYVDRILGLVSNDQMIQMVVNRFKLTRDRRLDYDQRRAFEATIAPALLGNQLVTISNPRDVEITFDRAYDELIGISVLGPLWRDEEITEVLVDGWNKISVERDGLLVTTPLTFRDKDHANRVARDLASKVSDRALTPSNPLVTALLPGARINFAYGPVVSTGLSISMRKFRDLLGIERLIQFGALTPQMAEFLRQAVAARATVLVAGGTGTGKTTQINALSHWIPDTERVVTIEDAFELQLSNTHVVALQTKEKASADDQVVVTQKDLLVNALRMRPDRIIVGEIREGHGAYVMLQAANTGHDGTMTTIHADSPQVAVNERLADLVMEVSSSPAPIVRRTVSHAINLVVQVTRRRGRRFLSSISIVDRSCYDDVTGVIVPEPIFVGELDADGVPVFRHVGGLRPDTALAEKLAEAGFTAEAWEPTR